MDVNPEFSKTVGLKALLDLNAISISQSKLAFVFKSLSFATIFKAAFRI